MSPSRDPRTDPRVGDVLRAGRETRIVTACTERGVSYHLEHGHAERRIALPDWWRWSAGATEVIGD